MNGSREQHWSQLVSETTIAFSPECSPGVCPLSIGGGSEYGLFCLVGDEVKHNKLIYHLGPKLQSDDIILEVQGLKVAGYTSNDLREWFITAAQNSHPVLIKTAKAGTLKKELRPYLNFGFAKGSVDHDTQMTIRENLFQRTVPCTTRLPRDGEVNGVDYTFVTLEEFKALEESGNLLESGGFDGNFYGMPKPPVVVSKQTNADVKPGAHPSSKGKRQRNRSTIEATSNKNLPIDNTVHSAHIPGTDIVMPTTGRGPSRGPTERGPSRGPTERGPSRGPTERGPSRGPSDRLNIDTSMPPAKPPHTANFYKTELAPPSPGNRPSTQPSAGGDEKVEDLPPNWDIAYTADGHMYFIDPPESFGLSGLTPLTASTPNHAVVDVADMLRSFHNTETTHWTHPKQTKTVSKEPTPQTSPTEDLPYGWEKVEDPHYGVYYIDHLNKKTQYDAPTKSETDAKALTSPSPSAKSTKSTPSYKDPDSGHVKDYGDYVLVSQQHTKAFFSKNPDDLTGDIFSTALTKSLRGFGFTIVGGDERDEEFLQIKNVVPHGPADQDGILRTGDVLMRVNDQLVLGYTHSDVVSMFQTIKPGEKVNLQVCRGYPLAFDPNDPNTEIVTTIAVSMPKVSPAEAKKREADRATKADGGDNSSLDEFADSLLHDMPGGTDGQQSPRVSNASDMSSTSGHMFSIEIVRGSNGFGFTIADSIHGQKVKHILDQGRCKTLQEGDILVRIAGIEVKDMDHLDVVDVLKGCAQGKPTEIVVQRGGSKKVPRPPSQSRTREEHEDFSPLSSPEFGQSQRMKFIAGADSTDSAAGGDAGSHVIVRPTATNSKPGMFKWTYNGSNSQLSRPNLQSNSSVGNRDDDDSEGQRTPPPIPSKGRLNSDASAKENSLGGAPNSSLPEAPSSMVLPSQLRDSTNIMDNVKNEESSRPAATNGSSAPGPGMLPNKQILGQHPVMNQYNYYQPPKESFYDVPNKFRNDSSAMTAQQRFDMMASSARPELGGRSRVDSNSQGHHEHRRSRTPGPEHIRAPPDRSTEDRFRSKTPNPGDHRSRNSHSQNNLNQPPSSLPGATSFESSTPTPSAQYPAPPPGWKEQWRTLDVDLRRGEQGFGFRIIGGPEEGTQVAIGYIVPGGVADQDRRLKTGDEIVKVNNRPTFGESHHVVVALMGQASSAGHVNLGIRRRVLVQDASAVKAPLMYNSGSDRIQPYDVIVSRREHEGFGFIIVSSVNRVGAVVGRIIENSPAERCGRLRVGDRIVAVNDIDISRMLHEDIVNIIKDSGYSVKLAVAPPGSLPNDKRPNDDLDLSSLFNRNDPMRGSLTNATALPSMAANETLVRNMNSHTATGTADRYNGQPLQNSKSAGNLSGNIPSHSQPFGSRSDSRLPSNSSSGPNYNDYSTPNYQPPAHPLSAYEPPRSAAYDSQRSGYDSQRPGYDMSSRQGYESAKPTGYDPSKLGVRTPMAPAARPSTSSMPSAANSQAAQPAGPIISIELLKSSRGFGFSIRGGREFNNMPLYVLRIAEDGAAYIDQRLQVGDEILEINDQPTTGMSHADAINLIQRDGSKVKLLIRRTGQLPNVVSEQGMPSPQGSGLSSPALRGVTPNAPPTSSSVASNSQPHSTPYEPNQNYSKDRYGVASRQEQVDGKYKPASVGYQPPELNRSDSSRGLGRGVRSADVRPAYPSDRYNPPPSSAASGRYEPAPRGYPVGRDNGQPASRPASTYTSQPSPYTSQPPAHHTSNTSQYNGPSAPYSQSANTPYNNSKQYQPNPPYNNTGYRQPAPTGSYNAGAMNRQTNQQMYNYYDSKPANQPPERQPPIGQNSFDGRGAAPAVNYPSSYGPRSNGPSNYKAMDYGPQGMIRGNNAQPGHNSRTMYSGQTTPGQPAYNNYNDRQPTNNYYSRQPTYQ